MQLRHDASKVSTRDRVLITGGNGFIGSHLAEHLHEIGYFVRVADISDRRSHPSPRSKSEVLRGNLCDLAFCKIATRDIAIVIHLAANMGGMGIIHPENDFDIYQDNHQMTLNLLRASLCAGVKKFFYASSACVYPESLQDNSNQDVSLREMDVWKNAPPRPQGLYGLEKLNTELLVQRFSASINVCIARFHNVYGPGGAWKNGREKAPAAMLRKALTAKLRGLREFEIWGDGRQRRSFLWIKDAVDAIVRLLDADLSEPVNIGSDETVSIRELAEIALKVTHMDPKHVRFKYDTNKPVGVLSRNSDNTFVQDQLGWRPTTTLFDGMQQTAHWMENEINKLVSFPLRPEDIRLLDHFQCSLVVNLPSQTVKFALLLPITSRGLESPSDCLSNLASFFSSLIRTTWRDTHENGNRRYLFKVYVAIDHDDDFLRGDTTTGENKVFNVLTDHGIADVTMLECSYPHGHVCDLWRHCAQTALTDGFDYFILLGDDVELDDADWMREIHEEFLCFERSGAPQGFGCVVFNDISFPGFPTFPVVHKTHMEIFNGKIIPDVFVNQDGDPFLFQLYRRWGCSKMVTSRIRNRKGGPNDARYKKQPANDWTFGPLDLATAAVDSWLEGHAINLPRKLTIDVIIPTYRVSVPFLDTILQLKSSETASIAFIIIVDNPQSDSLPVLESRYCQRVNVRIRTNPQNQGVSASRNRGIAESAAEWVHFLDDDVVPSSDLLVETEKAIRMHNDAAGFVGNIDFPVADTVFTTAVHLSGVTHFWGISRKMSDSCDLPWGVTANLIVRRSQDSTKFDPRFPKTGGGEDIDFILKKRNFSVMSGGGGFYPAPAVTVVHPWWNGGQRTYWRFYQWAQGDGRLIKLHWDCTFWDGPNAGELFLIACVLSVIGVVLNAVTGGHGVLHFGLHSGLAVLLSNMIHDLYRHCWRNAHHARTIPSNLSSIFWGLAIAEGSVIGMTSEVGRIVGILRRGEFGSIGRRFDWFVGKVEGPRYEERLRSVQRLALTMAMLWIFESVPVTFGS